MSESPFLEELHASFGLPHSRLTEVAERAIGHRLVSARRVVHGYDNEVHRVVADDGSIAFVRIGRDKDGTFDQELRAMELARGAGVPVPEILLVDATGELAEGRPVMVLATAGGISLAETLPSGPAEESRRRLFALGEVLARLHSVVMPGVWRPDDEGRWPDASAVRAGFIADRRSEHTQLKAAGLDDAETDRVMRLLDASPDPPLEGFVLCHGDLSPQHIFVDRHQRVRSIIDWGMWHSGSRIGDIACVARTFGWRAVDPIMQGYGLPITTAEGMRPQLALTVIGQLIGHVAQHWDIGDAVGAHKNVVALRDALRILDAESVTRRSV